MEIIHLRGFPFPEVLDQVHLVFVVVNGDDILVKTVFHLRNPEGLTGRGLDVNFLKIAYGIEIHVSEQAVDGKI